MPAPPVTDHAHDAERLTASPATTCLNCGAVLPGEFCPACGQRDQPLRVSVWGAVSQSFSEFIGVDGRVWRTAGALLFKPGRLTTDHFEGRRQRYLTPLRVYLLTTVSFFVLLALLDPVGRVTSTFTSPETAGPDSVVTVRAHLGEVEAALAGEAVRQDSMAAQADSLRARLAVMQARSAAALRAPDSPSDDDSAESDLGDVADELQDAIDKGSSGNERKWRFEAAMLQALPPDSLVRVSDIHEARAQLYPEFSGSMDLPEWIPRSESTRQFNSAKSESEVQMAASLFARQAIGHVPTVLFLILPVFALLLKLLYLRSGWYYSEHLVFGLHTHAFAFVVFSVVSVLAALSSEFGGGGMVGMIIFVLVATIPLYFLIAQKRVYGLGWMRTVAKSMVLGLVYTVVLSLGLVGAVVLAAAIG